MNIKVIPARCIKTADELKQIERQLNIQASEIENVVNALKRTEDEPLMIIASELNVAVENLHTKSKVTKLISTALSKIAAIYTKTDNGVADYENADMMRPVARYETFAININKNRVSKIFDKI